MDRCLEPKRRGRVPFLEWMPLIVKFDSIRLYRAGVWGDSILFFPYKSYAVPYPLRFIVDSRIDVFSKEIPSIVKIERVKGVKLTSKGLITDVMQVIMRFPRDPETKFSRKMVLAEFYEKKTGMGARITHVFTVPPVFCVKSTSQTGSHWSRICAWILPLNGSVKVTKHWVTNSKRRIKREFVIK